MVSEKNSAGKYRVSFEAGERLNCDAVNGSFPWEEEYMGVNFMLVTIEDDDENEVTLYAQYVIEEGDTDADGYVTSECDDRSYQLLKDAIIEQVEEYGLSGDDFTFWWDKDYHD